ncbi:phosphatidylglycerol lysyltransferase domain-containing protein, partial [Myxococcota bacterium]|nr:phosphatidylglycerol lysyltransferase domain-containing protein [Myxococcota bacterium]
MTPIEIESAIKQWGRAALSFDILLRPECYTLFFSREVPGAFVAYQLFGSCEVVMGDVVAPEADRLGVVREYLTDRLSHRRPVLGFSWPKDIAEAAVEVGAAAAQWTAEPELDPVHYQPSGKHAKKLRSYVRKLRSHGVEAREMAQAVQIEDRDRVATERLVADWLQHGPPRGSHLLEVEPWVRSDDKRFFGVFDPESEDRLWSVLI